MMTPDTSKVTITDRETKILKMLDELMINPRLKLIEWSKITKQTPNIKIGYPGQHLASLVTGVEGSRTGARGNDLCDASEVKSCSRIDQLDKCKDCKAAVARLEDECPECGSTNIERRNDSKWLFTIRSQEELDLLTKQIDRVLLILGDHPDFASGDFTTLRFQAFEIWPKDPRGARFAELMKNYYNLTYLGHRAKDPSKTPAPKNFWPESFQFYMCNPIKTFSCTVKDAETNPKVSIDLLVDPSADRSAMASELMPPALLNGEELPVLSALEDEVLAPLLKEGKTPVSFRTAKLKQQKEMLRPLGEEARALLSLRATDIPVTHAKKYSRL